MYLYDQFIFSVNSVILSLMKYYLVYGTPRQLLHLRVTLRSVI